MEITHISSEDWKFLRDIARSVGSAILLGMIGVRTYEVLTGLSDDHIRERMLAASCKHTIGGKKEYLFRPEDYERVLSTPSPPAPKRKRPIKED
jgi:hypothetical protein